MSEIHQIHVNVPALVPQSEPRSQFDWGTIDPKIHEASQHQDLSVKVFGQPKVLSILEKAFALKLSRGSAWDLRHVANADLQSYRAAARVFKRGVAVIEDAQLNNKKSHRTLGPNGYEISFVDHVENCFEHIANSDIVIVDKNVAIRWAGKITTPHLVQEFSEQSKNLETLATVMQALREHGRAIGLGVFSVFVVGGGVAGDIVGMASGLLGLPFHYVPTTLLAMADSSVGGKTGVNFGSWGKNQLGLFYQPNSVKICINWLQTLPSSEFRNGLSECYKHALIAGDEEIRSVVTKAARGGFSLISLDSVRKSVQVKCDVVRRDPYEKGERAILNFGHTLGHALEAFALARGKVVGHGECVALGMIHALRLSNALFGMSVDEYISDLIKNKFIGEPSTLAKRFGFELSVSSYQNELMSYIIGDKKNQADSRVRFVLLKKPGCFARSEHNDWSIGFAENQAWREICDTVDFVMNTSC